MRAVASWLLKEANSHLLKSFWGNRFSASNGARWKHITPTIFLFLLPRIGKRGHTLTEAGHLNGFHDNGEPVKGNLLDGSQDSHERYSPRWHKRGIHQVNVPNLIQGILTAVVNSVVHHMGCLTWMNKVCILAAANRWHDVLPSYELLALCNDWFPH